MPGVFSRNPGKTVPPADFPERPCLQLCREERPEKISSLVPPAFFRSACEALLGWPQSHLERGGASDWCAVGRESCFSVHHPVQLLALVLRTRACNSCHRAFEADDQTIQDFWYIFNHAVDLAATHPNALAIDRRVGTPVDDRAASRRNFDPIAMPPDTWIDIEIAIEVLCAIGIIPEEERHRGHGFGNNQLAYLVDQRVALLIESFNFCSKCAAL